jgi:gliding motility-associated-like protein
MRSQNRKLIDVSSFKHAKVYAFGKGPWKLLCLHLLIISWFLLGLGTSFGQDWTLRNTPFVGGVANGGADNNWNSVAYDGIGLWVAVASSGTGNRVMTSPDGITWTSQTSAADNNWTSVAYGNGLWVAVASSGTGNRVMTSPDGITWTARTSAADNNWTSVAYGNGLWVAVATNGTNNRVMTSTDGIAWTLRTSAADNNWNSVAYGNGLWIAVASSGTGNRVMTSTDGIAWTLRTSAADNNWRSVAYDNGLWVAVATTGTNNRVMTSPDGITWTARTSASDNNWTSVAYGNGLWVAVASTGSFNRVMTSPNGMTWTLRSTNPNRNWHGVAYGNGIFVAVAEGGTQGVMTSTDGLSWTLRQPAEVNNWRSVTFGNGVFVAVASGSSTGGTNRVMRSTDGITWTAHGGNAFTLVNVTYGGGQFVAVGTNSTTANQTVMTSPDGITWTIQTAHPGAWHGVTYGNGLYVAVSNGANELLLPFTQRVMTSPDGVTWTLQTTPIYLDGATTRADWRMVAYGNGRFVAAATTSPGALMSSTNGVNWALIDGSSINLWRNVTFAGGTFVALSNNLGTNIGQSPDGVTWTYTTEPVGSWWSAAFGAGRIVAVRTDGETQRVMTRDWASLMAVNAGNVQSAPVGTAVTTAPSVVVRDASNNPVANVGVTFSVASGGGSLTGSTAVTDVNGIATVGSWTIGAVPGTNTLTATVDGLTGSPLTFTATGTGPATQLSLNTPADLTAGGSRAAYTVTRLDANNNATTVGGALTVNLSVTGTSGVFYDAPTNGAAIVTVTIPAGQSSANFYFAATTAATYTITASDTTPPDGATGLADATDGILVAAGPAAQMTINTGDNQTATVGSDVFFAPSVLVKDANNNAVQGAPVSISVQSGAGKIYPALISNITPTYTVGGSDVTQNEWRAFLFTNGTTAVKVRGISLVLNSIDTFYPANIGVKVGIYSVTGGNPDQPLAVSDDRIINLSARNTWAKFLLNTELELSANTAYALVISGLDNTGFKWANTEPRINPMMYGDASFTIAKRRVNGTWTNLNDSNNPLTSNNALVLIIDPGVSGTINLTTNAAGIATLGSWALGTTAGTNTLNATITGSNPAIATTFTATAQAGAATQMAIQAGNSQTATVATAVSTAPAIIVKDVHNNPVQGVSVTFAVASGGGSITGATATTDANGIAALGSWTLGATAGTNTLTATSTGLTGSPLTFTAEAISGPAKPTQLSATPSDRQISISFTPAADGGRAITNYEYSLDQGTTWIAFNPAKTSSPLIITGLNNGTRYPVQIRALNSVGAGVASDEVSATPTKSIADLSVTLANVTYTGTAQQVKPSIKDGQTVLTENTDYTLSYSNNTNAGTARVSISGINRYSGFRQESFTISKASVSITADAKSKVYGSANPTLTYKYTGLVNGETKIATEPTISTTANTNSGVGKYPISLSGGTDPNYTILLVDAELTVTAATLNITADAKSKIFGRADPGFTYQVSGLKLNDREADVLSGDLTRQSGEKPGTYTISQGSLSANANYTINFTVAELTITAAQILSFVDLGIIETAWGKNPNLPAQVQVLTTNGQFIPMDIIWTTSGLNIFARGVYVISGTITLTDGIVNPLGVRPTATIRVLPKPAPQNLTLSNNSFEGSTSAFNIVIGRLIVIDPVDAVHSLSLATTVADNRYFTITNNVLYWNSPERAEGRERFSVRITLTDRDGNRIERDFEIIRTRKTLQSIRIPNTFTPNGDGVNDSWGVAEIRFFAGASIQIYERSGQRLFLTINPDTGWDGTHNGKPLPVGTYYWIIQIKETGEIRKGVLNLMR